MLNFKQYRCSPIFKIYFRALYFCVVFSSCSPKEQSVIKGSFDELYHKYYEFVSTNMDSAKIYIAGAYKIALQEKDTVRIANTLSPLAYCKWFFGEKEEALKDIDEAIRLGESLQDTTYISRVLNQKALMLADDELYFEAIEVYLKKKELAVLTNDKLSQLLVSVNIGYIKKMNQDYDEAVSIYKDCLEQIINIEADTEYKKNYKKDIYLNLADTYLRMKEIDSDSYINEAIYYNNLGLDLCANAKNTNIYYSLLMNKAIIYFEEKQYDKSIQLTNELKEYALNAKNETFLRTIYFYLGKNHYFQEKYQLAIENLEKLNEILQKPGRKDANRRLMHRLLALSYSEIREGVKSNFHLKEEGRLAAIEQKRNIKVISKIHASYDLPVVKDKFNKLQTEFKKQEKKEKWLYGISIFLGFVVIGGYVFYKLKVKRIQKRAAEVLQKVVELENEQERQKEEKQKKVTTSSISEKVTDEKAALLLEKLAQFEERGDYLSLDCSLSFVAEKVESNTSYVSNVINNYKNKTFKSYITELRINAALIRLKNDEKLRSYTIKAIAEEFGFKRQETFSKAFKTQTGIYPSQYLKKLRDDLEID